jgi:hypothetical protein
MKNNPRRLAPATYPVTISTPFGVLRLAYNLDDHACPDCGAHHGRVLMLEASPRLKCGEADEFLEMLPDLLASVAELSLLHCVVSRPAAVGA